MFIILHYAAILSFNIEKEHRFFPDFQNKRDNPERNTEYTLVQNQTKSDTLVDSEGHKPHFIHTCKNILLLLNGQMNLV